MIESQKQLYGVAIFEEEIVLTDFTGQAEKRFTVDLEQLAMFFRSDITFRPFPGLVWLKSGGNCGDTCLITLPAKERTILYRINSKKKDTLKAVKLHLPAIACKVVVTDNKISTINLWGFRGRELKEKSILYELPLPNLDGSSLCLGGTERIFAGDILGAVERTVFDTPFNHHNYIVGKEKLSFLAYVKKHQSLFHGQIDLNTLNKIGKGEELL